MNRCRNFAPWMAVLAMIGASVDAGDVGLVRDGTPTAAIVIHDTGTNIDLMAANLLVEHVMRMSGAELALLRQSQLGAISVTDGKIVAEKAPAGVDSFVLVNARALSEQLGVSSEGMKPGGLRVTTVGNAVVLLGGPTSVAGEVGSDAYGIRHAVIELLERLGCRYLWPGELGKVVPSRSTVVVESIDYSYTPPIRGRGIRNTLALYQAGMEQMSLTPESLAALRTARGRPQTPGSDVVASPWMHWQRIGGSMPAFGHAGGGLRGDLAELEAQHPDWFAMQADGTRTQTPGTSRWTICVSNAELIDHIASDIINSVKPGEAALVSLDFNDGSSNEGFCMCPGCEALDPPDAPKVETLVFGKINPANGRRDRQVIQHASLSDRHVHYWNAIAEKVTAVHPQVLLGVSAYSAWTMPPVREKLHPNLVLRYVPSTAEHLDGWRRAGASRVIWRPNVLLAGRRDGKLRSMVGQLATDMRKFADAGIVQTDFDAIIHNWAVHGVSYYAAARLTWNPSLSAQAIIQDFAQAGFGAGAPMIEKYILRVEQSGANYTPQAIAELRALLNEAEVAANDPIVSERIAFLRLGLNYTDLSERLTDLANAADAGETVDKEQVRRLSDLHALVVYDLHINHPLAINVPYLCMISGRWHRWHKIGGNGPVFSDPSLKDRLSDPAYGQTGREQSIDDILAAFGLE